MISNGYWYFETIHKYIKPDSQAYPFYIIHVTLVTAKALEIGKKLQLDQAKLSFIEEAGMLHDIGICKVEDEDFGTKGGDYITHGFEGAEILRAEGLPEHARVAESHTGVGIYTDQIKENDLPLPQRDFIPETLEERIISYADLFYSKYRDKLWEEKTLDQVRGSIAKFGQKYSDILEGWILEFEG